MEQIIASTPHDLLIHCGDYGLDLKGNTVYHVKGNCDPWSSAPSEALVEVEGHVLLIVHGHRHHVKTGLLSLAYYAGERGADIVLFGHTHRAVIAEEGKLILINPGSISLPPPAIAPSFVELTLDQGLVQPVIRYVED